MLIQEYFRLIFDDVSVKIQINLFEFCPEDNLQNGLPCMMAKWIEEIN